MAGILVKLEVQNLVSFFLAHVEPAVVGVHGRMAGLIPGPGEETVRLGEAAVLGIVF